MWTLKVKKQQGVGLGPFGTALLFFLWPSFRGRPKGQVEGMKSREQGEVVGLIPLVGGFVVPLFPSFLCLLHHGLVQILNLPLGGLRTPLGKVVCGLQAMLWSIGGGCCLFPLPPLHDELIGKRLTMDSQRRHAMRPGCSPWFNHVSEWC